MDNVDTKSDRCWVTQKTVVNIHHRNKKRRSWGCCLTAQRWSGKPRQSLWGAVFFFLGFTNVVKTMP